MDFKIKGLVALILNKKDWIRRKGKDDEFKH
jgi:hypothetical protein